MAPSKKVAAASSNALPSIDPNQTLKASKALLAHIKKASKETAEASSKRNLLEEADGDSEKIIWLTLTTKRHISDKARLQPGKIPLPHSLNASEETTVCLITADPQRAYKNIVASDEFPAELRKKVTRVIDITKLKAKYSQYEAQRKLFSEHDVFLGDDRIINRLPKVLGKTFYKTTQKRPIPVVLKPKARKVDGKKTKPQKKEGEVNAGTPAEIAKEIEKALGSALVSLSPTTNTAVRVGFSDWTAEQLAANVEAVAGAVVDKWVPQQWRNVKSIYIKGAETAALPIWLTDELWLDEKDVIADAEGEAKALKAAEKAAEKANIGKKRKTADNTEQVDSPASKKAKKVVKEEKPKPESKDDKLDQQISDRKARLRKQKVTAKKAVEE